MKYRSIAGTFGCLDNAELTFGPGLNVICAPNESGKSTWCALLTALLYGVSTSEKRRLDFLPDKLRFDPWSGKPAFGKLTVEWNGELIDIYRKTNRNGILQEFSAVYAESGEPVPEFTAKNAGEKLTGVSKDVFVRSAFFSGTSLAVSQNDELEKRIAALAGTGEEEVSASAVLSRLGKWANERQYQRRGRIPALAQEIQEYSATLAEIEQENMAALSTKRRLLTLRAQEEAATAAAMAAKRHEVKQNRAKIEAARAELSALETKINAIIEEYGLEGPRGDEDALAEAETALTLANGRQMEEQLAKASLYQASLRLSEWEKQCKPSPFDGLSDDYALEIAEEEYEAVGQDLATRPKRWPFFAGAISAAVATILIVTRFFTETAGILMPLLFIGLALGGIGYGAYTAVQAAQRRKNALAVCEKYGTTAPEGILSAAAEYVSQMEERRARIRAREEADQSYMHAAEVATLVANRAEAALAKLDISFDKEAQTVLKRLSAGQTALRQAKLAKMAAEEKLAILEQELSAEQVEMTDSGEEEAVALTAAEAEKARQEAVAARFAAEAEDARHQGRLSHYPDKAELVALLSAKQEELDNAQAELEAITLARSVLEDVSGVLSRRLTPKLSRRAEEIFQTLTHHRYDRIQFEKNWKAQVVSADSKEPREVFYLSAGATEQLYLSLRLALSEVVFEAPLPPLVLDDAFATFDDERLESALALLADMAKTRQILLFTCRQSEADRAEAYGAVRIHL
jgi:uncharacterized protein YhaN